MNAGRRRKCDHTFYVSGIPKSTCKRQDLFSLFSSVAQVIDVSICSEQGYGSVRLFDKSSVDFVLEKKWDINGSLLTLSRNRTPKEKSVAIQNPSSDTRYRRNDELSTKAPLEPPGAFRSYSEYQKNKPTFWQDIPHSNSRIVKRRKQSRQIHYACCRNTTVQTCKSLKRTRCQTRGKHRRKKKATLNDYYPYDFQYSWCHNPLDTKCHHSDGLIDKSTPLELSASQHIPKDDKLVQKAKLKEVQTTKLPDEGTSADNKMLPQLSSFTSSQGSLIPIRVHSNCKKYTIFVNKLRRLDSIGLAILQKEGIPIKEQLLLYRGTVLRSNAAATQIGPYEHLEIIVKARGGMMTAERSENYEESISSSSSEEEVSKWLRHIVKIEENDIVKCAEVDGELLFHYEKHDFSTFANDHEISEAVACRILVFRDSNNYQCNTSSISRWSVRDVVRFVHENVQNKPENATEFSKYVQEFEIDGSLLLQFKDAQHFHQVFPEMSVPKGITKKIFFKLVKILTSNVSLDPVTLPNENSGMASDAAPLHGMSNLSMDSGQQKSTLDYKDTNKSKHFAGATNENQEDGKIKEGYSVPEKMPDTKTARRDKYETQVKECFTFLEKALNLQNCRENDYCTPCKLQVITYTRPFPHLNPLEQKFLFLVLVREEDIPNTHSLQSIWKQISKNTMLWIEKALTDTESNMISGSKSGKIKIKGVECSLVGSNIDLKYLMDKELRTILKFENIFLLINRHVLSFEAEGYKIELSTKIRKGQTPTSYFFKFLGRKKYWVFDSDDFEFGFQNKLIDESMLGKLEPLGVSIALSPDDTEETQPSDSIIKRASTFQKILPLPEKLPTYRNDSNLEVLISPHKKLNKHIDEMNTGETKLSITEYESEKPNFCENRQFGRKGDSCVYHQGCNLSETETEGSTVDRCVLYNHVQEVETGAMMERILHKILRFACACLNCRRNGTIYFGIGNGVNPDRREILGFPMDYNKDSKIISDAIQTSVKKSFPSEVLSAAITCIKKPEFITVKQNQAGLNHFVMEIDVEPTFVFTKDFFFRIFWPSEKRDNPLGYKFDGLDIKPLEGNAEKLFMLTDMKNFIRERQNVDEEERSRYKVNEAAIEKLRSRLLEGEEELSASFWYCLVITCPTSQQKENEEWKTKFKFLKQIPFTAVFDFDDESNINGLCSILRNPEKSKLESCLLFANNPGKYDVLQNILEIPYLEGNVWIFSNGRHGIKGQSHFKRRDWILNYQTGISHAVNFLEYSISKKRILVFILLLSGDLEGVIDTFGEMISRFGMNHIIIIAEDVQVFEQFCKCIILEEKGTKEKLEEISIVGVPWENIKAAINEITGHNEYSKCYIPTASGAFVDIEEKYLETWADLEILSACQCELKKFDDMHKRLEFGHKQEIEFYRGNKVTWWNYYFMTHVMERRCFSSLRDKVSNVLSSPRHDTKVATLVINHEPGAGGSTLGRHLLWDFRKRYRCAVVKKITDRTFNNIMSFHHLYQEKGCDPKPVLLLIDEIAHSDFSYDEIARKIITESRNSSNSNKLICYMIILQREDQIEDISSTETSFSSDVLMKRQVEYLKQKCWPEEIDWLCKKYDELEETGKDFGTDFKPEHLISFMILRQNFMEEYVNKTVHHLVSLLEMESREFKLLKYTSLISAYIPSSRVGPKTFIPIECCDKLMDIYSGARWEQYLSSITKIFLVVEKKENASGQQIRLAHAKLAKAVLTEILRIENTSLGYLVMEFLDCSLFDTTTHGKKDLIEMTKEMLKRRMKEEYDDDVNTSFSPLIEDILKSQEDSGQSKSEMAVMVLKKGFEKFNDSMIAQSLGRLCAKHRRFDEAITWSKKAVDLSPKTGRSYCIHTLGYVMKTKFTIDTNTAENLSPGEAKQFLVDIFQALQYFKDAQKDCSIMQDHHFLYSYTDTMATVNMICEFLKTCVDLSVLFDQKKYLTDEDYIPSEVKDSWKEFHPLFKKLQQTGENVIEKLEDYVSFNTTFYAHDRAGKKRTEHRSIRLLRYKYPGMLSDFSQYFGEESDDPPPNLDVEMKNMWYRRRILRLQGNTYWGIFNHAPFRSPTELKRLKKIKKYSDRITEKSSKDISNTICVNIALGLYGDKQRESNENILKMCKCLVELGKGRIEVGHFFITILLWPSSNMQVEYDDDVFKRSLKYLSDKSKRSQREVKQKSSNSNLKEEKTISSPSTQFFLTKMDGLNAICHRKEIFFKDHHESQQEGGLWEHEKVKRMLKKMTGFLRFVHEGSNPYIQTENPQTPGKYIEIRKTRSGGREFSSEEEVSFYVGFSMAGPIAYNVKPVRHDEEISELRQLMPPPSKVEQYRKQNKDDLKRLLRSIRSIKQKRADRRNEREKKLLSEEDDIQTALDIKLERNPSDFHL